MSDEIELKLVAPASRLRRLNELSWVRACANGPPTRQTLISIYYDTRECNLYKRGISLRIRRIGSKRFQTIKAGRFGAPFARREWEMEISGSQPDFSLMGGTALEPLLDKALIRQLKPVFETRVRRVAQMINLRNGVLELASDQGWVRCGKKSGRISEVELELKAGSTRGLCMAAQKLSNSIPVAYSARSKLDRGYALWKGRSGNSVTGDVISLEKFADTEAAFQVIGLSCLRHLTGNEEAVLRRDAEGIHQMRVGLRRMRVAMSIFKDLLGDRWSQHLKSELTWLDKQLGRVRDYDVCLKKGLRPLERSDRWEGEAVALRAILSNRRSANLETVSAIIAGKRYRRLTLNVALWLADGSWRKGLFHAPLRARPAVTFAFKLLKRLAKKVAKKARRLEKLDAYGRHNLRISVKKLRYATEFFESYFQNSGRKYRRSIETLVKLQDVLGELNDIQVQRKILTRLGRQVRTKGKPMAPRMLGFLGRNEQKTGKHLLAVAAKAGKRLDGLNLVSR